MKQYILPIAIAVVAGMSACKKDGTTTTITNTIRDTTITTSYATGIVNADSLTAGLKVAYGANVTGTFPATSTDAAAPLLDTLYQNTYTVIRGRFLYIYPKMISGNVAGYYVQIKGAGSYFKVDYTKEYGLRKQAAQGFRSDATGYIDSAIVFKLPLNIKGDTFYVKYAAYDDQNRVSVPVTAGVRVMEAGSAAFNDSLSGKWKLSLARQYNNGEFIEGLPFDTINNLSSDNYACVDNKLVQSTNAADPLIPVTRVVMAQYFIFENYTFSLSGMSTPQQLDIENSTCSNYVYKTSGESTALMGAEGGYSYNSTTKLITIVQDNQSNSNISTGTFRVYELTANTLTLAIPNYENSDTNSSILFFTFTKQ